MGGEDPGPVHRPDPAPLADRGGTFVNQGVVIRHLIQQVAGIETGRVQPTEQPGGDFARSVMGIREQIAGNRGRGGQRGAVGARLGGQRGVEMGTDFQIGCVGRCLYQRRSPDLLRRQGAAPDAEVVQFAKGAERIDRGPSDYGPGEVIRSQPKRRGGCPQEPSVHIHAHQVAGRGRNRPVVPAAIHLDFGIRQYKWQWRDTGDIQVVKGHVAAAPEEDMRIAAVVSVIAQEQGRE